MLANMATRKTYRGVRMLRNLEFVMASKIWLPSCIARIYNGRVNNAVCKLKQMLIGLHFETWNLRMPNWKSKCMQFNTRLPLMSWQGISVQSQGVIDHEFDYSDFSENVERYPIFWELQLDSLEVFLFRNLMSNCGNGSRCVPSGLIRNLRCSE